MLLVAAPLAQRHAILAFQHRHGKADAHAETLEKRKKDQRAEAGFLLAISGHATATASAVPTPTPAIAAR